MQIWKAKNKLREKRYTLLTNSKKCAYSSKVVHFHQIFDRKFSINKSREIAYKPLTRPLFYAYVPFIGLFFIHRIFTLYSWKIRSKNSNRYLT